VRTHRRGTYSIVAADPDAGEVGCAVQSRAFTVGAIVPWVRASVGAAATQSDTLSASGPRILDALAEGAGPVDALQLVVEGDERSARRQYGAVTADGRAASFTGAECEAWAGDRQGDCYAAQGNLLTGPEVVDAMAGSFEASSGKALADRLMDALDAAEAAGGDRRGKQSAALVVEQAGAAATSRFGLDRVVDLRVDDHPEPLEELRRLLVIHWSSVLSVESYELYEKGDYEGAIESISRQLARVPESAPMLYNLACYEALADRRDDAVAHLGEALRLNPGMREMAEADSDFDSLRRDEEFRALVS
jgi:uncharacterized Ntn-hydrolase superfamily protein